MLLRIKDYILNLIAGRQVISGLYNAIVNARRICAQGGKYNYTFILEGFGEKRYSSCKLIELDVLALCQSLYEILDDKKLTDIDKMVIVLLKGRTEICNLYNSYIRAENAVANSKILCYTFTNPYENFVILSKNRVRLNEEQIMDLFNESKNVLFSPDLIINL